MASIYKRKDGEVGEPSFALRITPLFVIILIEKKKPEDWAKETELKIKLGKYSPNKAKEKTVADLIDLYIKDVVAEHHKASKDSIRQLNYFRDTPSSPIFLLNMSEEKPIQS